MSAIAGDVVPAMASGHRLVLHAGPPIAWSAMCGPMRGAVLGAILLEGWADTLDAATRLVDAGIVALEPCHHHGAVGPMAGVISPSMPVWVVENTTGGNRAYSNFNEGLGKVLRFGAQRPQRHRSPSLHRERRRANAARGRQASGQDRAQAADGAGAEHGRRSSQSQRRGNLAPVQAARAGSAQRGHPVGSMPLTALNFIAGNDHFFLNLSMAACKAMLDAAAGVPASTMVTAMSRNGVNFGIRLSGTADQWFEAPANPVDGLYFPGYSRADAAADLGDSSITETAGVGGFAMAAAPAIVKFVGGTAADALHHSLRMRAITLGANPSFTLPALDFAAVAAGIDARKVVDRGILPVINSGIAHREPGVGQIGAGITEAPMACFSAAVKELARRVHASGERT